MGTIFRIELYSSDEATASKAAEASFARAEELEQIMSDYREDSELMRLTRQGVAAPFLASNDLYNVLTKSIQVSELSRGAFDVTVGPLVELWRRARKTGALPDLVELAKARTLVDYRNIELDAGSRTVLLKRAGMKLDLGAIGKGYAADQMLALLRSRGIRAAMVVAGGEVALGAPPPGKTGWRVAVDTPDTVTGNPACALLLHDIAISTSGDAHQYLEVNGRRFSHVINPATGFALEGQSSTTVIARDSTTADALGTALSVMPVADGIRLAESLDGVAALWVRQDGNRWKRYASRGFPSCSSLKEAAPKGRPNTARPTAWVTRAISYLKSSPEGAR
jgi:thiamine biosynthesis lipoprotein